MDKFKIKVDTPQLKKELQKKQKNAAQALQATISDMRKRTPGIVAAGVSGTYNIKKSDMVKKESKVVSVKAEGETIDKLNIVYVGRPLSLLHSGMTPKKRPLLPKDDKGKVKRNKRGIAKKARAYSVTAEVIRGQRHEYKGNTFLGKVKKKKDGEESKYIAFERIGKKSKQIKAIKRISVPQMIDNKKVAPKLNDNVKELLRKRLNHNMKRFGFKR